MGLHFNMPQSKVFYVKVLEPILIKSLNKFGRLPARSIEQLNEKQVSSVTVMLDRTKRTINRPKYEQKDYSEKKESHDKK